MVHTPECDRWCTTSSCLIHISVLNSHCHTQTHCRQYSQYIMGYANLSDEEINGTAITSAVTFVFPLMETIILIISIVLLSVLTIAGNVIVFVAFTLERRLQTFSDFLILNLAVADFIVGIVSVPLKAHWTLTGQWLPGPHVCVAWLAIDWITVSSSGISVCVISLDRYLMIGHPLWYRSHQSKTLLTVLLAVPWIVPAVMYIPIIVDGIALIPDGQCGIFYEDSASLLVAGITISCLCPLLLTGVFNVMVFLAVHRRWNRFNMHTPTAGTCRINQGRSSNHLTTTDHGDQRSNTAGNSDHVASTDQDQGDQRGNSSRYSNHVTSTDQGGDNRSNQVPSTGQGDHQSNTGRSSIYVAPTDHRDLKNTTSRVITSAHSRNTRKASFLFVFVGIFAAFWVPTVVALWVSLFCFDCITYSVAEVLYWTVWMNSAINPVLYPVLRMRYRRAFKRVLCCMCRWRTSRSANVTMSTNSNSRDAVMVCSVVDLRSGQLRVNSINDVTSTM
jgi:hypothetical protein